MDMTLFLRTHPQDRRPTRADEGTVTLVELLVVVLILGALVAIAVPAYLNFTGTAQSTAAAAEVREAITDANAYYADNESYTGMTPPSLVAHYDSGLKVSDGDSTGIVSITADGNGQAYCISAVSAGHWAHYSGPGGKVIVDPSTVTRNPCS